MFEIKKAQPPRHRAYRGFVSGPNSGSNNIWTWLLFSPEDMHIADCARKAGPPRSSRLAQVEAAQDLIRTAQEDGKLPLDVFADDPEAVAELTSYIELIGAGDVEARLIHETSNPERPISGYKYGDPNCWAPDIGWR